MRSEIMSTMLGMTVVYFILTFLFYQQKVYISINKCFTNSKTKQTKVSYNVVMLASVSTIIRYIQLVIRLLERFLCR